jgi:hypothetical protein
MLFCVNSDFLDTPPYPTHNSPFLTLTWHSKINGRKTPEKPRDPTYTIDWKWITENDHYQNRTLLIINELPNPFFCFFDPVCPSNATRSTAGKNHIYEHTAQTSSRESQINSPKFKKNIFQKGELLWTSNLKTLINTSFRKWNPSKKPSIFHQNQPKT